MLTTAESILFWHPASSLAKLDKVESEPENPRSGCSSASRQIMLLLSFPMYTPHRRLKLQATSHSSATPTTPPALTDPRFQLLALDSLSGDSESPTTMSELRLPASPTDCIPAQFQATSKSEYEETRYMKDVVSAPVE